MRTLIGLTILACGCGTASHGGGGFVVSASVAPVSSAVAPVSTGASPVTAATVPATIATPTTLQLATAHAPLYRFNAYYAAGPSSLVNRSEDYFPMSVESFFDQLEAGQARVVITESSGATPGTNAIRPAGPAVVDTDAIHGVPARLSGDDPGTAPVYFHAYEDMASQVRNPDGSGQDVYDIEYWLFYGRDMSREEIAGIPVVLTVGGHIGDWETVALEVAVVLGPGGSYLRDEILLGIYSAHGKQASVEPSELELVDDQGAPDPAGGHPVAYIAVGKHASYPEPGMWTDPFGLLPLVIHDEWFLGNGYIWASWNASLLDLDGPASDEFTPASFAALEEPSLRASGLVDWRHYKGTFGDTEPPTSLPASFGSILGESPPAPEMHGSYGAAAKGATPWHDIKAAAKGLVLGAVPEVVPAPIPQHVP